MNNKGQTFGLAIMVAIMIFLVGMMVLNVIMPEVTTARSSDALGCAAPDSDGAKLLCLTVDLVIPYFILLVISTAGGIITARLVL